MKSILQKSLVFKLMFTLVLMLSFSVSWSQTYFNMSTGNYSEAFTSWTTPTTGVNWSSVAINATGVIPSGTRTTVASTAFTTTTTGGVQNGSTFIQFLSTGATSNTSSVALDLNLNFTGRVAGSLSFNSATVFNSTGDRVASLKVYYSLNGTTWTELTGTNLPYVATNTVPGSAVSSVVLPAALNNQATVKLRFYNYNGTAAGTTGSRPKISIDNVSVTSTASSSITTFGSPASLSTIYGTASSTTTFEVSGTNMSAGISINPPAGFEVSNFSDFSSNVGTNGSPITVGSPPTILSEVIYLRLAANATAGNKTGNIVLSSSGASNVNVVTNATNTVSQKELTISGLTANNKVFDNNTIATLSGSAILNGIVSGDNVSLSGTPTANFNDATVGVAKPVTVSGYTLSGTSNANYFLTLPILSADIIASGLSNQTITFNALSPVTYGDSSFVLTATSDSGLTVTYVSSNENAATILGNVVTIVGAGSTTITASQAGNLSYNPATPVNQVLLVNQKTLTISGASANNKIYDGNNLATISGGSLVGVVGIDDVSFSGNGTFDTANVGTAKTVTGTLLLTGTKAPNYILTQPILSADILAKELTISGISILNKQYDTTTTATIAGTPSLVGVVSGDGLNVSLAGSPVANFSDSAVGTNKSVTVSGYSITGSAAGNYLLTQPSGFVATITVKILTIVGLTADNKIYDRTTSATLTGTASLSGIISGDEANISLDGTPSATFSTFAVGTSKPVTVLGYSISGASLGNYSLSSLVLTANILKKDVSINGASANDKTYDGNATATLNGTLNGVISPDAVTLTLSGTFLDANVGTNKTVTSTSSISGTDSSNYNLVQPTGLTASITAGVCGASTGLVTWNFGTAAPTSNTTSGVTISNLTQGNNNGTSTLITATSPSSFSGASAGNNAGAAAFIGVLSATSTYFEFTVTPQAGYNVALTGVSFGSRSTGTGPKEYVLKSNLDGFTSSLATGILPSTSTWVLYTPTTTSSTSVNSIAVVYRLYGYNGAGGAVAGSVNWRIDDLKLNLTATPGTALTSATTATICSGDLFSYSPTTNYTGSTITWTRAAVSGVSNVAITTPQTSNPSENLINVTSSPVNVIYSFTVTTNTCFVTQNVSVTVNPIFSWYLDADNDGYYVGTAIVQCDSPGIGYRNSGILGSGDCDDSNTSLYQSALLFVDIDGDSYTVGSALLTCYGVTIPVGTSLTSSGSDCNDANPTMHASYSFYVDTDGDGYGSTTATSTLVCAVNATTPPTGYVANNTDCNDSNSAIFQSAILYTDVDNDGYTVDTVGVVTCYGSTLPAGTKLTTLGSDCNDANPTMHASYSFYVDTDGDGYGSTTATSTLVCAVNATTPPTGYSVNNTDCDDTRNIVHPGAIDVCGDGLDNDCNGNIDNVGMPGGCIPVVTTIRPESCGVTLAAIDTPFLAYLVSNAQGYRWRVTKVIAGLPSTNPADVQMLDTFLRSMKLTQLTTYSFGTTYQIEVSVKLNNVWQPFYGSACNVTAPALTTTIKPEYCGTTLTSFNDTVLAFLASYTTGYRFKVTNLATSQVELVDRTLRDFRLNMLVTYPAQYNTTYNIQVALRNTDGTYLPYGTGCNITSPTFPTTQLQLSQCDYTVMSNTEQLLANLVTGGTMYRFKISNALLGYNYVYDSPSRAMQLVNIPNLLPCTVYSVQVAVQIGSIVGSYSKICTITTPGGCTRAETPKDSPKLNEEFKAVAYPNPFAENFKLDVKTSSEASIQVRVYDMLGKLVEDKQVQSSDIESFEVGNNYPSGVYNVIVTQAENVQTLRVIKR